MELTIQAASLDTKLAKRDTHLRSGDFFDAARHPQVRFVSDDAELTGEKLVVRGRLEAAGKQLPPELTATVARSTASSRSTPAPTPTTASRA